MLLSYNLFMKPLKKILLWSAVIIFGFFVIYWIDKGVGYALDDSYHLKNGEKFQYSNGLSMGNTQPDRLLIVDTLATPKIGDIISFECLVDKCDKVQTIHRLVGIDSNGCMQIVGDNQNASWDTNDYGCLMPDEIKINGVVIDK